MSIISKSVPNPFKKVQASTRLYNQYNPDTGWVSLQTDKKTTRWKQGIIGKYSSMLNKPRTNSGPHSQHVALKLSWEQGVFYQLIISNKKNNY